MGGNQTKDSEVPTQFDFTIETIGKNIQDSNSDILSAAIDGQLKQSLSNKAIDLKCECLKGNDNRYTKRIIKSHGVKFKYVVDSNETILMKHAQWSKDLKMDKVYSWIVPNNDILSSESPPEEKIFLKNIHMQIGYYSDAETFCFTAPALPVHLKIDSYGEFVLETEHNGYAYIMDIGMNNLFSSVCIDKIKEYTILCVHWKRPPLVRKKNTSYNFDERCRQFGEICAEVIGQSDVLRLTLTDEPIALSILETLKKGLKDLKIRVQNLTLQENPVPISESYSRINGFPLDFEIYYAIIVFQSCGLKAKCKLDCVSLLNEIKSHITKPEALKNALHKLAYFYETMPEYFVIQPIHFLRDEMESTSLYKKRKGNQVPMRKVTITPLRIKFEQPQQVDRNRVIRTFDPDFMLNVSFRDENDNQLCGIETFKKDDTMFTETISNRLINGLELGERHYLYLGGSNSQLREHGCCLYAKDKKGRTSITIRQWVGELDSIRCVAQYVARLGLAFSQTEVKCSLTKEQIRYIADIEHGRDSHGKSYCFTDGVGMISQSLATKIWGKRHIPSAFQMRIGGCKGVLAINPLLNGDIVCIRPSMEKFKSKRMDFEIQDTSKPARLKLNHQIITILSQMGDGDNVFFELQEKMIDKYLMALFDNQKAYQVLRESCLFPNQIVDRLSKKGYSILQDEFHIRLLSGSFRQMLERLKRKSNIELDANTARNMMGVVDEAGVLQYGQVFVRYSSSIWKHGENPVTLTGPVVVSKMPCLHPGDVRRFQAVEAQGLEHLTDVIVFPQKGHRPHPDEMAGSDLDGDTYFVCWDTRFQFKRSNYQAMDFPSAPKKEKSSPVTPEDMIENLKTYIMTDKEGIISRAHLKMSDLEKKGIFSRKALELADLHAKTVDAPKTGFIPTLSKNLKPRMSPDFLEQHTHNSSYDSPRILGKLYRQNKKYLNHLNHAMIISSNTMSWIRPGYETYVPSAVDLQALYRKEISNLVYKYGFKNEIDVWTNNLSKQGHKRDISKTANKLKNDFRDVKRKLRNVFKENLRRFTGPTHDNNILFNARKDQAWACFIVSHAGVERSCADRNTEPHSLGLPWVFPKEMTDHIEQMTIEKAHPLRDVDLISLLKRHDLKDGILFDYLQKHIDRLTAHLASTHIWFYLSVTFFILWLRSCMSSDLHVKKIQGFMKGFIIICGAIGFISETDKEIPKPESVIESLIETFGYEYMYNQRKSDARKKTQKLPKQSLPQPREQEKAMTVIFYVYRELGKESSSTFHKEFISDEIKCKAQKHLLDLLIGKQLHLTETAVNLQINPDEITTASVVVERSVYNSISNEMSKDVTLKKEIIKTKYVVRISGHPESVSNAEQKIKDMNTKVKEESQM